MVDRLQFVSDMTDSQVCVLAELLAMPPKYLLPGGIPSEEWLVRQEAKIIRLPRELTKPSGLVDRTRIALAKKGLSTEHWLPKVAVLCSTHAMLNPWLVHRVFLLLQHEVMHRVNPVRYYRGGLKTQEVLDYCTHVSGILSLSKTPAEFAAMCRAQYPAEFRFERIASGCEACVLAAVGSRAQLLVDLKASLLARVEKRREPRLMRFVDCWMRCFGAENEGELLLASQRLSEQIRAINKAESKRRWEVRRAKKERIAAVEAERDELEKKLMKQRVSASQLRMALGDIDKKLERKYGKDWEKGRFRESRSSGTNARKPKLVTNKKSTQPLPTPESTEFHQSQDDQQHAEPPMAGALDNKGRSDRQNINLEQYYARYEEAVEFEQDERNPDQEQQLEQSIDDWYQRSVAAASRAPSGAEPFDWSGSDRDDRETKTFDAESAVPSPLLIAKNAKGKDNEVGNSSATDRQELDDDRSWVSVTVHSSSSSDEEVGAASDAPPVPRIPSRYGVFENLTREEAYAPSSVYSTDNRMSTFASSPASTAAMVPANRSSTTLPSTALKPSSARNSTRRSKTPLESPARSPFHHSSSKIDGNASVSTLSLSEEREDNALFQQQSNAVTAPSRSVVSSALSPGTKPSSDEYLAMQAELEEGFSMVNQDDGVSDEMVRPDESISQPRLPTRVGTGKFTLRSVAANVRPVRNGSRRNDSMKYLGLYRDE